MRTVSERLSAVVETIRAVHYARRTAGDCEVEWHSDFSLSEVEDDDPDCLAIAGDVISNLRGSGYTVYRQRARARRLRDHRGRWL